MDVDNMLKCLVDSLQDEPPHLDRLLLQVTFQAGIDGHENLLSLERKKRPPTRHAMFLSLVGRKGILAGLIGPDLEKFISLPGCSKRSRCKATHRRPGYPVPWVQTRDSSRSW